MTSNTGYTERLAGVLLGTAVGDAVGLPAEGIGRRRIARMVRRPDRPWRHRLVFGRGMISDDTEHTLFVAQALIEHPDDPRAFARVLAWKLRLWFLGLPAGIGKATLFGIVRLWFGFPPERSGVFSAGNGPAMRSAIVGAFYGGDPDRLRAFVRASTRLTHTDPKAQTGALAIAALAAWAVEREPGARPSPEELAALLAPLPEKDDPDWRELASRIVDAVRDGTSAQEFASQLGLERGVSGYVYHTVPVAIVAWLHGAGDFSATLEDALDCGGDTDTVGAIVGALAGASLGADAIPTEWLDGILEWPRSVCLLRRVAERLAAAPARRVRYSWPGLLIRNPLFLIVVLAHGFRRLLPPY